MKWVVESMSRRIIATVRRKSSIDGFRTLRPSGTNPHLHVEYVLAGDCLLPYPVEHGADSAVELGRYGRAQSRYVLGRLGAPAFEELGTRAEP